SPLGLRKEMQESRAEGQKVPPVADVFHDDQIALGAKYACDFAKQAHALVMTAQFVGGKDAERGIEGGLAKRQGIIPGSRGGRRVLMEAAGPMDGWFRHNLRIEDVYHASDRIGKDGREAGAALIQARMNVDP